MFRTAKYRLSQQTCRLGSRLKNAVKLASQQYNGIMSRYPNVCHTHVRCTSAWQTLRGGGIYEWNGRICRGACSG